MAKYIRCDMCKKDAIEYAAAPTAVYTSEDFEVSVSVSSAVFTTPCDLCRECLVRIIEDYPQALPPQWMPPAGRSKS